MICPILSVASIPIKEKGIRCAKEDCAWWDVDADCCAILNLSLTASMTVYHLQKSSKDIKLNIKEVEKK